MSPLCAAGMRSGNAGASALRMVSITVGSGMLHRPSAAGHLALRILPSGRMSSSARKQPSFTGASPWVRFLNATRAAASPPE